jgi:ribonuclease P protein component
MAGFPKRDRLRSRKTIDSLFGRAGESFAKHPVRFVWKTVELPEAVPIQAAFSVSKKNFKRAVQRNRIKRRLREAWRTHKSVLEEKLSPLNTQIALMIIYQGKEESDFALIEKKMAECVRFFLLKIKTNEKTD